MLRSVKIENFRGLQSLDLQDLGRLNLLVGANNCGKTSILEGIQLLCSQDDIDSFLISMETRGESSYNYQIKDVEFAIQNLFYDYTIQVTAGAV
ncbi:AAA family ATPase [Roseofilum sp. Guam]|uniref:AAA family ATPase n=1 Tax=Roseofilum sp. Guam TaxID=2821502 RepID=UPI001B1E85E4|nr:AAA family ATPase [Roseofilum sp. Guam]MBP0029630.1 AAA family ATPase [Roseofilum sp. Guam]